MEERRRFGTKAFIKTPSGEDFAGDGLG